MKILKIFFIILVPTMGFVSCKKSCMHPDSVANSVNNTVVTPAASNDVASKVIVTDNATPVAATTNVPDNGNANVSNARLIMTSDDGNETSPIVGSGDDDRDGGDKKKKR